MNFLKSQNKALQKNRSKENIQTGNRFEALAQEEIMDVQREERREEFPPLSYGKKAVFDRGPKEVRKQAGRTADGITTG